MSKYEIIFFQFPRPTDTLSYEVPVEIPDNHDFDAVVNPGVEAADEEECDRDHTIDFDDICTLKNQLLNSEKAQRMAEFFRFLGDANRLQIISALALKEQCVHELAATVTMSESAISHQLRNLRAHRLVSYRKQGRQVFYRLKDRHIFSLYEAVAEHIDEKDS